MNENLTSTKFILTAVCLILVSAGFFMGMIASDQFTTFLWQILGIYTVTNTASKLINRDSAN